MQDGQMYQNSEEFFGW